MKNKQLILRELLEIIEIWDKIPIGRHLACILRPYSGVYDWTDEQLLKKIEKYRAELEKEQEEHFEEED
jgi:hypothetical protein